MLYLLLLYYTDKCLILLAAVFTSSLFCFAVCLPLLGVAAGDAGLRDDGILTPPVDFFPTGDILADVGVNGLLNGDVPVLVTILIPADFIGPAVSCIPLSPCSATKYVPASNVGYALRTIQYNTHVNN